MKMWRYVQNKSVKIAETLWPVLRDGIVPVEASWILRLTKLGFGFAQSWLLIDNQSSLNAWQLDLIIGSLPLKGSLFNI